MNFRMDNAAFLIEHSEGSLHDVPRREIPGSRNFRRKLRRCVAHQRRHNGGREDLLVASTKAAEERPRVSGHRILVLYFQPEIGSIFDMFCCLWTLNASRPHMAGRYWISCQVADAATSNLGAGPIARTSQPSPSLMHLRTLQHLKIIWVSNPLRLKTRPLGLGQRDALC